MDRLGRGRVVGAVRAGDGEHLQRPEVRNEVDAFFSVALQASVLDRKGSRPYALKLDELL
jgi:hypothetical protein